MKFIFSNKKFISFVFVLVLFFSISFHKAHAQSTFAAPDIYNFSFEDGTFGQFIDNVNRDPLTAGWVMDSSTAGDGTKSVSNTYPPLGPGVNSGGAGEFYYVLPSAKQNLYIRFEYKQQNPFNVFNGISNHDGVKMIRLKDQNFNGLYGGVGIGNSGLGGDPDPPFITAWDLFDTLGHGVVYPNTNLPAPGPNDFLGQWHCFEFHYDIRTTGALHEELWIDNTKYVDTINPVSNQGTSIGVIQFDGTINSMSSVSTAWFDDIGVSDQRIGCPSMSPVSNPAPTSPTNNSTPSVLGLGLNTSVPPTTPVSTTSTSTVSTTTSPTTSTSPSTTAASSTPSQLSAVPVSGSEIDLSWTASSGAVSYNIYRCNGSSCNPNTLIGTSTTTIYKDTSGLHPNNNYSYAVKASDASSNISSSSTPTFAMTGATPGATSTSSSSAATSNTPTTTSTNTTPTSSGGAVFTTNLQLGSRGSDVTRLQKLLAQDKSLYPEGIITGTFGSLTRAAVMRFQLKYGVITSPKSAGAGKVGPLTRMELGKIY